MVMPIIVDIALFTIQAGVIPFRTDFLGFVKLYFLLVIFSWGMWMVFSKWDSVVLVLHCTGKALKRSFQALFQIGSKAGDGEEHPQLYNPQIDVERGRYQDRIRSRVGRIHSKAQHVADFNRATSGARRSNIEAPGEVTIEGQAVSVRGTPQIPAAGFNDPILDIQREPRPRDQKPQVTIDAPKMSSEHSYSTSLMGHNFARVHAQWSSAETTEARLDLLESLAKHNPMVLPEATSVGSTWKGWLRCEWELPSVVQELQESDSSEVQTLLGNFVTITGSLGNMECSTCSEFLQKTWGKPGLMALEALSQGVALLDRDSTASPRSTTGKHLEIHPSWTHIVIEIENYEDDAQSFIDSVVWICTAVRVNLTEGRQTSATGQNYRCRKPVN